MVSEKNWKKPSEIFIQSGHFFTLKIFLSVKKGCCIQIYPFRAYQSIENDH